MKDKQKIIFFWFRRDIRLNDNTGLYSALKRAKEIGAKVVPVFIFDSHILEKLEDKADKRVHFFHHHLGEIHTRLKEQGSGITFKHGDPIKMWQEILKDFDSYEIDSLFLNHDYELTAIKRDDEVKKLCTQKDVQFFTFKDHVIFEKDEVVKDDGDPYVVYTPYMKKWRDRLQGKDIASARWQTRYYEDFLSYKCDEIPSLKKIGFEETDVDVTVPHLTPHLLKDYHKVRDLPAKDETSRMGHHLRFGTVSIRELAELALHENDTYLNELVWREFFIQILWHFPHVVNEPFREKYKGITWSTSESNFKKWCEGKTGFPIVDAGMRQLNTTGFMHNRVRMIVASFLVKDLLIDWRKGERYFASKLLDYELASNNGNWQWAAGTGCDAAPYFRIFNPHTQFKKFDPDEVYVKRWVEEYGTEDYPEPMVDHKEARLKTLDAYKSAIS